MYVSAAGALANSYQQDVIANNLANVDTVAFKRDLALLQSRPVEAAQSGSMRDTTAMLKGIGGGLFALPTHTDFSPASLKETGSNFDFALTGKGFLIQILEQLCLFSYITVTIGGGSDYSHSDAHSHNNKSQYLRL